MFVFASMGGAIAILMAAGLFGSTIAHAWSSFFRFGSAETLDTLLASLPVRDHHSLHGPCESTKPRTSHMLQSATIT